MKVFREVKQGDSVIRSGVVVIYENPKQKIKLLLGCKPTNWEKAGLDICKGHIEMGETPIDAAVRELKEESGIEASKDQLKNPLKIKVLGNVYYLWSLFLDEFIEEKYLTCPSTFTDKETGEELPEMSGYKWLDYHNEIEDSCHSFQEKTKLLLIKYFNVYT
jgi:8-oxo-dGTP pyrophosphatase MutT (NUDIX family)